MANVNILISKAAGVPLGKQRDFVPSTYVVGTQEEKNIPWHSQNTKSP